MVRDRKAYFKAHASERQRATFVKRQQARLKALQSAAACTTPDTTPPALTAAAVSGSTLTLAFDETLVGGPPTSAFSVRVDNLSWPVTAVAVSGTDVTLTLVLAVDGGQTVTISYTPPVDALRDAAGNETPAFTAQPTNGSPAAPVPSPGSFSPSLAKPAYADVHEVPDPSVGEWGPKNDPQWVTSTGHLHALLVPIDFPDVPATRPASFYDDLFAATTPPWYAEASYGRLSFDLTALDHYVRMSNPIDSYALRAINRDQMDAFFRE